MARKEDSLNMLGSGKFRTTLWSVVLAAGKQSNANSQEALARLCQTYWYPIYVYVRRQGHNADEAQDLTQDFFAKLLSKNYLQNIKPERGKFRSYLLSALKHFLADEWDRARAQKRGGGQKLLRLDVEGAEDRYKLEPSHSVSPEKIFDKRWALTLLEQVLKRLSEEYKRNERAELFERLKVYLVQKKDTGTYGDVAKELDMTENAVKVAVHRLRQRYRALLKEEILQTVSEPEDVDEEIRYLFQSLS
jgi:RNA polymerase sigma factor (sigma-70 family)